MFLFCGFSHEKAMESGPKKTFLGALDNGINGGLLKPNQIL